MMSNHNKVIRFLLAMVVSLVCSAQAAYAGWFDAAYDKTLSNSTLKAQFQAGNLYKITDLVTGQVVLNKSRFTLPATLYLFGSSSVNLNNAAVIQTVSSTSIQTDYTWTDGTTWRTIWSLDGNDLVFNTSAHSPIAKQGIYITFLACDILTHTVVANDYYGVSATATAPYTGALLAACGGTDRNAMSSGFAQTMIVLFEGSGAGWVVEGRDPNIGPANIRPFGNGSNVDIVISRGFFGTSATQNPSLFEVRIRTYNGAWQNAVDPYIAWMEDVLGYIPMDKKPQTWVKNIRTQAYVTCTDYAGLEALAARFNPAETFLGRQAEYRYYAFDQGYPDYNTAPGAAAWISQAAADGFHVGLHTNTWGIDRDNTALLTLMEPGLIWDSGTGNWVGTSFFAYCVPSYTPWRNYLVEALAPVVNSGAKVIYLDQSQSAIGGHQSVMLLEQQILQTYPTGVAIETEGFNLMCSRYAQFALAEMPLGHPLGGYIFSRFIKIVPEGYMISPTDLAHLDAFATWGYMLPSVSASSPRSWLEIGDAFQQFDLEPNSRLPRNANQLSGFTGVNGITAFFEKTATTRSLVVYEPCQTPVTYGLRHTNINQWPGPGYVTNWLIYSGNPIVMYGLDPIKTYGFDESVSLNPARFHITAVPADFLGYQNDGHRLIHQEIGYSDTNFRFFFSGNGSLSLYAPAEYDVYHNSEKVTVSPANHMATIAVSATPPNYSVIRAFKRSNQVLQGYLADLSWTLPQHKTSYFSLLYTLYPPHGLWSNMAGEGFFIGKFPFAQSIRLQGYWGMTDEQHYSTGDGVIKINGTEVARISPGLPPYTMKPFDVDITSFSGKYAMLELMFEGNVSGTDSSNWKDTNIVVTGITGPETCEDAISVGYGFLEDFNNDCYLNMLDLEVLAQDWLKCMDPMDAACERPWL